VKFDLKKPIPLDDLGLIARHVDVRRLQSMRGIITGCEGWFGTWLCAALDHMGCEYDKLDMRDPHPVEGDYCIHLAKGELSGLIDVLREAQVKHVLFTSSGAVYDMKPSPIQVEKCENEELFINSGLPVNIARVFTVIGGGVCQRPLAVGAYIKSCLNNEPIKVYSGGRSMRSYIYMADLVIWLLNILFAEVGVYDVGGAKAVTMLDLAHRVADCVGGNQSIEVIDSDPYNDPHPIYKPNTSKAKALGLEHYTDLDTALAKTIEWERP